jgi:hypothetical protein
MDALRGLPTSSVDDRLMLDFLTIEKKVWRFETRDIKVPLWVIDGICDDEGHATDMDIFRKSSFSPEQLEGSLFRNTVTLDFALGVIRDSDHPQTGKELAAKLMTRYEGFRNKKLKRGWWKVWKGHGYSLPIPL